MSAERPIGEVMAEMNKRVIELITKYPVYMSKGFKTVFSKRTGCPGGLLILDNGEYEKICPYFNKTIFRLSPLIIKDDRVILLDGFFGRSIDTREVGIDEASRKYNKMSDNDSSSSRHWITSIIYIDKI